MATEGFERKRLEAGYGGYEASERDKTVSYPILIRSHPLTMFVLQQIRQTMRAIKHALTERWYAWEDARRVAQDDEEVNLSGEGPAYVPRAFEVSTFSATVIR